ncbi:MAG: hypothetical protein WC863_01185 [Patescibacteria group bacterium]
MSNLGEILCQLNEGKTFNLPEVVAECAISSADSSADHWLHSPLRLYEKNGLSLSGLDTPPVDIMAFGLTVPATFKDLFFSVGGINMDYLCLTTEQSLLFVYLYRRFIINMVGATCCFLFKEQDSYKVACVSMWPSWFENLTIRSSKSQLLIPFRDLSINLSKAKSQEDCLGLIGEGNAIVQTFSLDNTNLLSPSMNIIALRPQPKPEVV